MGRFYNQEGYLDIREMAEEVAKRCEDEEEAWIGLEEEIIKTKKILLIFLSILQELYTDNSIDVDELFYSEYYLNQYNKYRPKEEY